MKKQTITQKRATLFREWLLATLGNDERYYCCTLAEGIPDGDDIETVLDDLADGFYDDYLDEMIDLYLRAKKRYAESGWYVNEQLIFDESEALVQGLKGTGYELRSAFTRSGLENTLGLSGGPPPRKEKYK